jgi:hypothetical protein
MRRPLLLDLAAVELPQADGGVEGAGEKHRAEVVPLEREDGPLVHREDEMEVAGRTAKEEGGELGGARREGYYSRPDASDSILTAGSE